MTTQQVPPGFEASHTEWLRIGGETFRKLHQFGPRQDFYRTKYWKLVKEAVLTTRKYRCFRCDRYADQVHHLNYDSVGQDHLHPESLAATCKSCHGLIEYARKAESLISRISRRISLCKGFLEKRYPDQNPTHICTRLLEYQHELAELRKLFETKTHFRNPRTKSTAQAEAVATRFHRERQAYEEQAANLVSTWSGSAGDKAERLLRMLELEIHNCREFAAEVLRPIPHNTAHPPSPVEASPAGPPEETYPSESTPESAPEAQEIELLVVGIKYHRGNVDGLVPGDSLRLVRDTNNPYDPNAIKAALPSGETLGYLTREHAAFLVNHIGGKGCIPGRVLRIAQDKVYVAVVIGKRVNP